MSEPTAKIPSPKTPKPATVPKLYTLQQGAADSGIPYMSLYDLVARGHLPSVRLPGNRRIWIRQTDLAQLIERGVR